MAENGALSPRQSKFVAAILATPTVTAACKKAGIGQRTGWRYLADPAVQAELTRRQDAMLAQTAAMLAQDSSEAVAVLMYIAGKGQNESARVGAARAILAHVIQMAQLRALSERMAAIERRLGEESGKTY